MSGLLNIIDGVGAGEGRILVATTNYYDRLDEALIRPGRIDLEVKFELASKYQAGEQFRQFYVPHTITKENLQEPGIVFSEKKKKKSQSLTTNTDQDKNGSTPPSSIPLAEKYQVEDKDHLHLEEFTTRIDRLADQFAEDFPEYVISSASLQQYLLMYKSDPIEAVANFKTWVQAEIERKDSKERSKQDQHEALLVPKSQPDLKLPSDGSATAASNGVRVESVTEA